MLGFSKKEFRPLSEYPKDSWSVLEQKDAGLIIRMNDGPKEAVGHPDYPVKMGVAVPVQLYKVSTPAADQAAILLVPG